MSEPHNISSVFPSRASHFAFSVFAQASIISCQDSPVDMLKSISVYFFKSKKIGIKRKPILANHQKQEKV